jgi:hypothetical protein
MDDRTIKAEHKLVRCTVGPDNCGDTIILFRAPVVRDGSGTYKRMPHQIQWQHLQEDDSVIAVDFHDGPSGQKVLHILQFWHVIRREEDDMFTVDVNNIVGMSADGDYVFKQIGALLGLPQDST